MPRMTLSETQKKYLRGLGHTLKPVVTVANAGLSESLLQEFETSIGHHELIKVKFRTGDRNERDQLIEELCKSGSAELVVRVGNIVLLYRRNSKKPKIRLP